MKLTGYRLTIPVECWRLIGWKEPLEIIAELIPDAPLVRLHLAGEILPRIQERFKTIQDGNAPNRLQLLARMQDRYNEVSFYKRNRAVELTARVVAHLGVDPNSDVFVEGTKHELHVMSLAIRSARLRDTAHETDV